MGNSPVTGEFPAQMASNAENIYILRRHHSGEYAPSKNSLPTLDGQIVDTKIAVET